MIFDNSFKKINGILTNSKVYDISYPIDGNDVFFGLEEKSFWFIHRNKVILNEIRKRFNGDYFFDVGGGNGIIAKEIQKSGINVHLVEPSLSGCLNARKRGVNNIINSSLEDLNLNNNSLDAIGIFDVLEHIDNDNSFLQVCFEKLKGGGAIFIAVPAFKILWSKEDELAGHMKRYTIDDFIVTCEKIGFKLSWKSYFFSYLFVPVLLYRVILGGFFKKALGNAESIEENFVLKIFSSIELFLLNRIRYIPFGTSLFVILNKP